MAIPLAACVIALGVGILYKSAKQKDDGIDDQVHGDHVALSMREVSAKHWADFHYRLKNESPRA